MLKIMLAEFRSVRIKQFLLTRLMLDSDLRSGFAGAGGLGALDFLELVLTAWAAFSSAAG